MGGEAHAIGLVGLLELSEDHSEISTERRDCQPV